jgi:heme-degrading monooxygenase HmoA
MISRVWHGWTAPENADAYEKLLRLEILPGIHRVRGFKGARVLRRELKEETEFLVITKFHSIEDVKQFSGEDYAVAVIEPAARKLLTRFDARCLHYETVIQVE